MSIKEGNEEIENYNKIEEEILKSESQDDIQLEKNHFLFKNDMDSFNPYKEHNNN